MPELMHNMQEAFQRVLKQYSTSKSPLQLYMQENPVGAFFIKIFAGPVITREVELANNKRAALSKLLSEISDIDTTSFSTISPDGYFSPIPSMNPVNSAEDLTRTPRPDSRYFASRHATKNQASVFNHLLTSESAIIDKLRQKHAYGQSEGILIAMHKTLNYLSRVFNEIASHLVEDFDDIKIETQNELTITGSHPALQVLFTAADFAWMFAYDHELKTYSESKNGHVIDDLYYLGTGAKNLSYDKRNELLLQLSDDLHQLAIIYTMLDLCLLKNKDPHTDISKYLAVLPKKHRESYITLALVNVHSPKIQAREYIDIIKNFRVHLQSKCDSIIKKICGIQREHKHSRLLEHLDDFAEFKDGFSDTDIVERPQQQVEIEVFSKAPRSELRAILRLREGGNDSVCDVQPSNICSSDFDEKPKSNLLSLRSAP